MQTKLILKYYSSMLYNYNSSVLGQIYKCRKNPLAHKPTRIQKSIFQIFHPKMSPKNFARKMTSGTL